MFGKMACIVLELLFFAYLVEMLLKQINIKHLYRR